MTMKRLFEQDALDHDFSDEFVEALGGIGDSIVRAHERDENERLLDGDFDDEEERDETGADLLASLDEDDGPEQRAPEAPPADEKDEQKTSAYSKEDAEALSSLSGKKESDSDRLLREANERIARLERQLTAPAAPAAPAPQAAASGKIKPTGNKEVDDYLADAGLLDTTPQVPAEVLDRLAQLETANRSQVEQIRMQARANALVADAREKAARITKVFKDVPEDHIAQVIVASNGDADHGLDFARGIYKAAGVLGSNGLPTGHLSERKRAPMPHTRGVNGSRPARRSGSGTGSWAPTNDPAERAKRMANY